MRSEGPTQSVGTTDAAGTMHRSFAARNAAQDDRTDDFAETEDALENLERMQNDVRKHPKHDQPDDDGCPAIDGFVF